MATLQARELRTTWRRRLFTFEIGALIALAILLAVGSPIVAEVWQPGYLAPLVVATEIVVVFTGITWLALFALSKRRRDLPGAE